jgi:hypothetical protein
MIVVLGINIRDFNVKADIEDIYLLAVRKYNLYHNITTMDCVLYNLQHYEIQL